MLKLWLSDYKFIPQGSSDGSGTVLAELSEVGYELAGRLSIPVVDRSGRSVVYEGGGPTYFSDSEAGTQEFAGWSYFESEDSEDPDGPCVQLFVLSPGCSVAGYLSAQGIE